MSLVHDIHVAGSAFHHLITTDLLGISEMNFLYSRNCNNTVPLQGSSIAKLYPASSRLHSQDMHAPHASYKPRVHTGDQLDI